MVLPVAEEDLSRVSSGQQYKPPGHVGVDFGFDTTDVKIVAPYDAVIMGISEFPNMGDGNIVFGVYMKHDAEWNSGVIFEPDNPNASVIDEQRSKINVVVGETVVQGQQLGKLVVSDPQTPGLDWYPHIHWTLFGDDFDTDSVCPRDYMTPQVVAQLDAIFTGLGLIPVCLD